MDTFFIQTLSSLSIQLFIKAVTAYQYKNTTLQNKWIYFLFNIVLALLMYQQKIPVHMRYGLLIVFSIFNGYLLSVFLKKTPSHVIKKNIVYTLSIFLLMIGIAFGFMKYDVDIAPYMFFGFLYTSAMSIMFIYMLLFDPMGNHLQKYRLLSIGLFSLYIVLDTYMNYDKEYDNDIVISTLDYYFDVYGIFKNLSTSSE